MSLSARNGSIFFTWTYFRTVCSSTTIFMSTTHFWPSNRFIPDIFSFLLYDLFLNTLLSFIRPVQTKAFNVNDSTRIKLIKRLQLLRSNLGDYKFRNGFKDAMGSIRPFSIETETTTRCFVCCYVYNVNKSTIMNDLNDVGSSFSILNYLLLHSNDKLMTRRAVDSSKILKNLMSNCYNIGITSCFVCEY